MRCPECAAEVSPLREFCPDCGTPIHPGVRDPRRPGRGSGPGGERTPEELQRNRKTMLAIGAAILIFGGIWGGGRMFGSGHHVHINTHFDPVRVESEAITIGAPELFEAYHRDSDAADRRFGSHQMVVTGQFVRTVPDGYGSIDMRLKTNHPDLPLGIDLDSHSVDAATKLEPGETVTVSCEKVAGSGDNPWLQDCVLQPPPIAETSTTTTSSGPPPPPAPPPPPTGG